MLVRIFPFTQIHTSPMFLYMINICIYAYIVYIYTYVYFDVYVYTYYMYMWVNNWTPNDQIWTPQNQETIHNWWFTQWFVAVALLWINHIHIYIYIHMLGSPTTQKQSLPGLLHFHILRNPYKPSFATVPGWWANPIHMYIIKKNIYIWVLDVSLDIWFYHFFHRLHWPCWQPMMWYLVTKNRCVCVCVCVAF